MVHGLWKDDLVKIHFRRRVARRLFTLLSLVTLTVVERISLQIRPRGSGVLSCVLHRYAYRMQRKLDLLRGYDIIDHFNQLFMITRSPRWTSGSPRMLGFYLLPALLDTIACGKGGWRVHMSCKSVVTGPGGVIFLACVAASNF